MGLPLRNVLRVETGVTVARDFQGLACFHRQVRQVAV
jgi:hypothetical protein